MKKFLCTLVAANALVLIASSAYAQGALPVIRARQSNERARIRQGVASGELTRSEAARMRGREAGINAEKRAARADGVVTNNERRNIRHTENSASRAIYRQKHDGQVR